MATQKGIVTSLSQTNIQIGKKDFSINPQPEISTDETFSQQNHLGKKLLSLKTNLSIKEN